MRGLVEAAVTDMTYRDLFAHSRDLRQKLARAKSSAEASELTRQIDVVRELRLTIHLQIMQVIALNQKRMAS